MSFHPQVEAMLAQRSADQTPPLYTLSLPEARALDLASIKAASGDVEPVAAVRDSKAGERPIRIYCPRPGQELPVLVYFFGGGWALGSLDTSDGVCRRLANAASCLVIAVGYRLAPEHKFPTAVHDCFDAVRWVLEHARSLGGDPARVAVAGDSAGGNLAAAVTLLTRDAGLPLVAQVLVYPNTDYTAKLDGEANPLLFNKNSVAWYWGHYLSSPKDGISPLASPLLAPSLSGLPPALVITAEHDPLREQAEAYANRLAASGVPTTLRRYDGMIHGFFCMAGELKPGAEAQAEAASFLRSQFGAVG
jgi:acetyl esterase